MNYVKLMYGTKSDAGNFEYKINEVNTAENWNPKGSLDTYGGFYFSNDECILRWLSRGDTLYDVKLPKNAELIKYNGYITPNGLFVSNKIIISNPRKMTDELAMEYYLKSNMPIRTYFDTLATLACKGFYNTALKLIKDKIKRDNIILALEDYQNYGSHHSKYMNIDIYNKVLEILKEIQSNILISLFVDKEMYIKELSNDKIINLTGQSGSGKSYFANQYNEYSDYLIIDTDDIFSDSRFEKSTGINKELGEYFRKKYNSLPSLINDFDLIYKDILNYCNNINKTIIIDCAQFHSIKNIKLLKGKIVIMRTCIDTCYNRCIDRFKKNNLNYTNEALEIYSKKKKGLYTWYKGSNEFIKKIEEL